MRSIILAMALAVMSCNNDSKKAVSTDGWLKGDNDEKFKTVTKHLRGFDMAMVETGYCYTELYWAGQDQKWEYANYQLDKIKTAIENGIERRPKRARSAQVFLQNSIPTMREAIQQQDTAVFNQNFIVFQTACKSCHIAEKVPFIQFAIPQQRLSPINLPKNNDV